ncbi:hypothetical protein LUZ62_073975 [Rhynchospora pubera]|uniref:DUF547 domain-containing protein n=1 Tax=Rhynchospora pubera TaxID=906938 RepID=A0AAV8D724_9POAL|nr:hypothetical protein LUZ62_073975 [Rhynchospora pubera]
MPCSSRYPNACRLQLEHDVQRLEQLLEEERYMRSVLENALEHAAVKLSDLSLLPNEAQELLSHISTLEMTITRLEEEFVSLHFQLIQERNERRLAEYRLKQVPLEEPLCSHPQSQSVDLTDPPSDTSDVQQEATTKFPRQISVIGLSNQPNLLSEEIVRCMRNIFLSLAGSCKSASVSDTVPQQSTPSPTGNYSISPFWSSSEPPTISSSLAESPQIDLQFHSDLLALESAFDPYRSRDKLSWADIGSYNFVNEVSWMSPGKEQLDFAADALGQFRLLVEQLGKVNPIHLDGDERLAFWINIYNALMMHAYLAYGVPRGDMKLFSLMQKAAYTVGGHSFNASCIECVILKMKLPIHRSQMSLLLALQKLKVSDEQKKFSIVKPEPLVAFALSCGMYSSPAVKVYTARNVREELESAQRDFMRASVGVSKKGKLLVPKLLHSFARGVVDDTNLPAWVTHFLPPHQAAFVEHCMSQRRQSFLASRAFGVLPFENRFRYLFFPDKLPC